MNWEDERWVRLYTRDTVNWQVLGWKAQTVLLHLLRKVDRAGVMDTGGLPPAEAISAVTGLPMDVTEPGVSRLEERGTVTLGDEKLLIPNFLEAQECRMSDRARQRRSRESRRDGVTRRDDSSRSVTQPSQNVTECHTRSHGVTRGHNPDKTRQDKTTPPHSPPAGGEPQSNAGAPKRKRRTPDHTGTKRRLLAVWHEVFPDRSGQSLTRDRSRMLDARLNEGLTEDTIADAFRGATLDTHYMGQNDNGKKYTDITNICRKGSRVEDFANRWRTRDVNQPANENYHAKVVREAERYTKLNRMGDALTEEQLAEMRRLRPSYDKYQANGQHYDRKAAGE